MLTLGFFVKDWDELKIVDDHLKRKEGIQKIGGKENRVRYHFKGLPFDIVPFGGIEKDHKVSWPPFYDTIMTVLGFEEALKYSLTISIKKKEIRVVAPEMLIALKLIAWNENPSREKDASDAWFLINNYDKLEPTIYEYILDHELSLFEEFDLAPDMTSSLYIGVKLKKLLNMETLIHLRKILSMDHNLEKMASIATIEIPIIYKVEKARLVFKSLQALRRALEQR